MVPSAWSVVAGGRGLPPGIRPAAPLPARLSLSPALERGGAMQSDRVEGPQNEQSSTLLSEGVSAGPDLGAPDRADAPMAGDRGRYGVWAPVRISTLVRPGPLL